MRRCCRSTAGSDSGSIARPSATRSTARAWEGGSASRAVSGRRQHRSADFAEADAHGACAFAVAAQAQGVAVFEEGAALAIGQRERLLAAQREFEQRAG